MYEKGLFQINYTSIQRVRGLIGWDDIVRKYDVKAGFKRVLRHLANKGYIFWKKSGEVASLSRIGAEYVLELRISKGQEIK